MMIVSLLLVVITVFAASSSPPRKFRIFGGSYARYGAIPFQVLYVVDNVITCGGALISPTVAMTAAHCIPDNYNTSFVYAGTNQLFTANRRGVAKLIVRTLIHEEYDDTPGDNHNDIALLFLDPENPFVFNQRIQAAILPSEDEDYQNSTARVTISGWGATDSQGTFSSRLKYAKLNLVPRDECISLGGPIKTNVICASSGDGSRDACGGDSGGPLAIGRKVIGIVSYGWPCETSDGPGAYADLAKLRSWIRLHANI